MVWYRKASGLNNKDIDYSYSIKTKEIDQSEELIILKAELATSQNKAKFLGASLQKIEQQRLINKQKLALSKLELKKAKFQLKNNSNTVQKNIVQVENKQLKTLIENKKTAISQQQKINQRLQSKHLKQVKMLTNKLLETQKHLSQLLTNLRKNKSIHNTQQIKALKLQEKLVKTEQQLLIINNKSKSKLDSNKTETLNKDQKLKVQLEMDRYQLVTIKKQLQKYKKEKHQQKLLIKQLNSKSRLHQKKLKTLESQLANKNNSTIAIKNTQKLLLQQKFKEKKTLKNIQNYKEKYSQLTQNFQAKEELYNVQLAKIKLKKEYFKSLYLDLSKQSNINNKQLKEIVLQKKKKWNAQQVKIETLIKEKQKLNKALLATKNNIKKQENSIVPIIEIIDPAFVQIRGVPTITMRSVVNQKQITGKIISDNEVFLLSMNDQNIPIMENGLFKNNIMLLEEKTPVNISVVDNKGNKASIDFIISAKKSNKKLSAINKEKDLIKSIDFGQYYALIIGNNEYEKAPSLLTPINDAKVIDKLLKEKYGFKTQLLLNASRYEILSALNKYRSHLNKNDNLLIYYAGHGELDKVNMRGHWLPVDADTDNTANWISTVALTDIFNAMSVNHLMVVADSCYSGAMTRSSLARLDTGKTTNEKEQWLKAMINARSRTVLTSGGLKPVLDGGGGNHSLFAKFFIESLRNNNSLLEGQNLYRNISAKIVSVAVSYGVEQVPQYAPMQHAGHEAGEFFFVPK